MKKVVSIILCLVLCLSILSGCGNKGSEISSDTTEDTQDAADVKDARVDLNFAITSEPQSLDPPKCDEYTAYTIIYQIYDRLIEIESDGTMVPSLAESWELSEDSKSLTFNIRKGVKFHNGEELTADDVVYSLNRAIESPITAGVTATFDYAEKVDDYTVILHQNVGFAAADSCMPFAQLSIVCKSAMEEDAEAYARNPIGTGAYKMKDWKMGDRIELVAFDDYWKGEPVIKDLNFKIILDTNTVVVALENGEVDICDTAPAAGKSLVEENPDLEWYTTPSVGSNFIIFNNSVAPFDNKLVRQAIGYAVDKEAIVLGALEGDGLVAETLMARGIFGYPEDFKSQYEYNPEKAKELLAEAGYPDGFSVSMPTMDSELFVPATEVVQDQLKQVGIDITIDKYERGVWLDKVRIQHDYGFCVMNTNASYPDADYIYPLFHSSYIESGKNWSETNNPELDKVLEEARGSSDKEHRQDLYRQAVEIMDEEMFVVPLYNKNMGVAANKDLKNVVPSATRRLFVFDYSW